MATRMDVLTGREKDGKTYWTRIGVAFPARDGGGWNLMLDALPVSGQCILREPKPRENRPADPNEPPRDGQGNPDIPTGGDLDDEIPF